MVLINNFLARKQDILRTQNQINKRCFIYLSAKLSFDWVAHSSQLGKYVPRFHEKKSLVSSRIFKLEAVALHALFEDSLMELAPAMDPN